MKKIFLFILITISIQISAQEFAPIGAKWHYSQGTVNPTLISFKTIESIADTSINGKGCKKLKAASQYKASYTASLFMYSANDSVFVFKEGDFHLLYDFGAVTGDTITIGYYKTYDGLPLKMIIDSTSTVMIYGRVKKLQYVTCGDGMVIEFGGKIIEGIGNTEYMFPLFDGHLEGALRCYEDNLLGLFHSPFHPSNGWDFQNCEQTITGIMDLKIIGANIVYPNPTTSSFAIANLDRTTDFEIFDINGRKVMSGIVNATQAINVVGLPKGIYFMVIINNKQSRKLKVVKQ